MKIKGTKEKIIDALEDKKEDISKERLIAIQILEMFEDYLQDKGVKIPNKERDEYETDKDTETAILFGSDWYSLEDEITDILENEER